MITRRLFWLLILLGLGVGRVSSDDTGMHVVAPAWGLTLAKDGTGFYNDLAGLLLSKVSSFSVQYEVRPYRRAKRHFLNTKSACIFPLSIHFFRLGGDVGEDTPLIETDWRISTMAFLFSRPGMPTVTPETRLNGARIGFPMGGRSPAFLKATQAQFLAVVDEEDKGRMLLEGRVDYIAANMPDAQFVFDSLNAPLPPYDSAASFSISGIQLVCHDTPTSHAFISAVNTRQAALIDGGELAAFYAAHGLNPGDYLSAEPIVSGAASPD